MKRLALLNSTARFWQTAVKLGLLVLYLAIALVHLGDYAWLYDEGVLLQTAALSYEGYPLYSETVVNKPPLFVWWVQLAFAIGGVSVESARLAVLVQTAVLLWLLGSLAKSWWGAWADVVAMAAYLLIPESIVRAAIVLNDLPAMMMMIAALLAGTHFFKHQRPLWAALVGGLFALGVGLHPLLIYMGVPLGLLLAWPAVSRRQWQALMRVVLWASGTAVLVTLLWLVQVDWPGFWQWVVVYNRLPLDPALQAKADRNLLNLTKLHGQHAFLLLPALWAYGLLWWYSQAEQRFFLLVVGVWYLLTLLVLLTLQPMWFHYVIFAFIPLAVVVSGGVVESWRLRDQKRPFVAWMQWLFAAVLLLFGLFTPREWVTWEPNQRQAADFLQHNVPQGSFVISDDPHLLFVAGLYVPPPLADSSTKRISTQLLTSAEVVQVGWQYGVSNYVLTDGRFFQLPELLGWVDAYGVEAVAYEGISVLNMPDLPETPIKVNALLNEAIVLEAASFEMKGAEAAGLLLEGTFLWQTAVPLADDYKIFVHLLDESGNLVAQYDGSPQQDWLPTSQWVPYQPVYDSWQMQLPPEVPAGQFTLLAGMYTWPAVYRLPAQLASGETAVNSAVPISQIQIP